MEDDGRILQFDVVLTKEDLLAHVDREVAKISKKGLIKGFRPGHVPKSLVRNRYGDSLLADAFQELLETTANDFLSKVELPLIDAPVLRERDSDFSKLNIRQLQDEYRITFEAGLYPSEIRGLSGEEKYERFVADISQESAEQTLEELSREYGTSVEVSNGIRLEDLLELSLSELDGEIVKEEGLRREGGVLWLSKEFPEEVTAAFLGRSAGEVVRVRLGALRERGLEGVLARLLNSASDALQGIGDWFEVRIDKVRRLEPAALTEAFFQQLFGEEVRTREQAIEQIKAILARNYTDALASLTVENILARLETLNDFDLPERYTQTIFQRKTEKSPSEAPEAYERFLRLLRRRYFLSRLQALANVYPTEEDVKREVANSLYRTLSDMGLTYLFEQALKRQLQDEEVVLSAERRWVYRHLAQALPAYLNMSEHPLTEEDIRQRYQKRTADAQEETAPPIETTESVEADEASGAND